MNTVADGLRKARELLVTKGWTQGCAARDANGNPTMVRAPAATCFCGDGAVLAVTHPATRQSAIQALNAAAPGGDFVSFNDAPGRTLPEVLVVFAVAIAAEDAKAAALSDGG